MMNINRMNRFPLDDPDTYVRVGHFMHGDDAALFGALALVGNTVDFVIVDDPNSALLRRHAELQADEMAATLEKVVEQFPDSSFAEVTQKLFGKDTPKEILIEMR